MLASFNVHVAFDVVSQLHRVLAHQPASSYSIAGLEGLDDLLVVSNRALCPVLFEDGSIPDRANMHEQSIRDVVDQLVLAEPDYGLVKLDVCV